MAATQQHNTHQLPLPGTNHQIKTLLKHNIHFKKTQGLVQHVILPSGWKVAQKSTGPDETRDLRITFYIFDSKQKPFAIGYYWQDSFEGASGTGYKFVKDDKKVLLQRFEKDTRLYKIK